MARDRIEKLLEEGSWPKAQRAAERELRADPENHWLWASLCSAKYEQHNYSGALKAAKKAVAIVPDCPLALWHYAGALDMLGKARDAAVIYANLILRGLDEIKNPDEDAEECWESSAWTWGVVEDSMFRLAGCAAGWGDRELAIKCYQLFFLSQDRVGRKGIYSRQDAKKKLKELTEHKEDVYPCLREALGRFDTAMA